MNSTTTLATVIRSPGERRCAAGRALAVQVVLDGVVRARAGRILAGLDVRPAA